MNTIKLAATLAFAISLVACTHGSVSNIPLEIKGVGTVYRYQGRANFSHQIAEADKMMTEHCQKINGGKPVIVDLQKKDLGMVVVGSTNSNTQVRANANTNTATNKTQIAGTANTQSIGTASALQNTNQEILYKCETK